VRLYAYIAAALLLAGFIGYVAYLKHRADKVEGLEQTIAFEQAAKLALQQAYEHERKINDEASNAYQAELRRIRDTPSVGVVRLCRSPTGYVPAPDPAAARPNDAPAGRVEVEAGDDIGPALDRYGSDCEAVSAQLRGLQGWVRAR
jgi:hypothetical protein